MNQLKITRLNNRLTYFMSGLLIFCFVVTLVFVTLPRLEHEDKYPDNPGERRLFVSTWNFACTLMWVTVIRVQILNEISDTVKRKENRRSVTPWVKFWFAGSILIGSATIAYVIYNFVATPPAGFSYADVLSITAILSWITLIILSVLLFFSRKNQSKRTLPEIEKALPAHRWLIAPASVLFFLSTFLFPLIFLL